MCTSVCSREGLVSREEIKKKVIYFRCFGYGLSQKNSGPHHDWSPLEASFKISEGHPHPFICEVFPRACILI